MGKLLFVLEMQEELPQLTLRNPIGWRLAIVGNLANAAQISVNDPLVHASKMEVILHAFVELPLKNFDPAERL